MYYKKPINYKTRKEYIDYVLDKAKNSEWTFFFTANGNNLKLEWQKKICYYDPSGKINSFHCDFYYEDETGDIKIAIECDDKSHKNRKLADSLRAQTLDSKDIILIRFDTKELNWNCLACIQKVKNLIQKQKIKLQKESYDRKYNREDISINFSIKEKKLANVETFKKAIYK